MKKTLIAVCATAFLLSACENTLKAPTEEPTVETGDIIAEADIDYDVNGDEEKLYVRMVTGELKEEKDPGPFYGTYWEGDFQLELVSKDGALLHTLDLNPTFGGESLIFTHNRELNIAFDDYNNDGYPDFSIGQYFSSNGFMYNLFSLTPNGIAVIHQDLFTADSSYSVLYPKAGNTSFKNRYYDMENGEYVETLFTWQGDRFVRTECEGCNMDSPPEVYYVKGEVGVFAAPEYGSVLPPDFVAKPGEPYAVVESANGFLRIKSEGREGWIDEWYVTPEPNERSVVPVDPYVMLVGTPVAYRRHPGEKEPSGFELQAGKVVQVYKEYQDWVCIRIITYDQPYEGDKWVRTTELVAWDPAKAKEGKVRPGAVVRRESGEEEALPIANPVYIQEEMNDDRYRIGSAGGLTGFIDKKDFIPNPFLPPASER
ncbi:hypothetical protein AB6A23_04270 [Paenibacillus tarimensis]